MKIGFLCEGPTDEYFLKSSEFKKLLDSLEIILIGVRNLNGKGNLKTSRVLTQSRILFDEGAEKVFVLVDLDHDKCITKTKELIPEHDNQTIVVAVREVEAWLLADRQNMADFLEVDYELEFPEKLSDPKNEMLELARSKFSPRILTETKVFYRIMDNGFSLRRAAQHPNCPSAAYFLNKLSVLNTQY
ncbi:DUF4276 family protein [Runella aurantiaca]|nr:DUF4276 family protein [Runella aurantiaca]